MDSLNRIGTVRLSNSNYRSYSAAEFPIAALQTRYSKRIPLGSQNIYFAILKDSRQQKLIYVDGSKIFEVPVRDVQVDAAGSGSFLVSFVHDIWMVLSPDGVFQRYLYPETVYSDVTQESFSNPLLGLQARVEHESRQDLHALSRQDQPMIGGLVPHDEEGLEIKSIVATGGTMLMNRADGIMTARLLPGNGQPPVSLRKTEFYSIKGVPSAWEMEDGALVDPTQTMLRRGNVQIVDGSFPTYASPLAKLVFLKQTQVGSTPVTFVAFVGSQESLPQEATYLMPRLRRQRATLPLTWKVSSTFSIPGKGNEHIFQRLYSSAEKNPMRSVQHAPEMNLSFFTGEINEDGSINSDSLKASLAQALTDTSSTLPIILWPAVIGNPIVEFPSKHVQLTGLDAPFHADWIQSVAPQVPELVVAFASNLEPQKSMRNALNMSTRICDILSVR